MTNWKFFVISFSALSIFSAANRQPFAQLDDRHLKHVSSKKTVHIRVEETYREFKNVTLPFKEYTQELFEIADVSVIHDSQKADIIVTIQAKGDLLGGTYRDLSGKSYLGSSEMLRMHKFPGSDFYYTGAKVSGSFSIDTLNLSPHLQTFEKAIEPSPSIQQSPYLDRSTNIRVGRGVYKSLFSGCCRSFAFQMMKSLGKLYGTEFLLVAFRHEDREISKAADEVLEDLKDPATVEPLTQALREPGLAIPCRASDVLAGIRHKSSVMPLIEMLAGEDDLASCGARALRKMTLEDFGKDQVKWRSWWEENKRYFRGEYTEPTIEGTWMRSDSGIVVEMMEGVVSVAETGKRWIKYERLAGDRFRMRVFEKKKYRTLVEVRFQSYFKMVWRLPKDKIHENPRIIEFERVRD